MRSVIRTGQLGSRLSKSDHEILQACLGVSLDARDSVLSIAVHAQRDAVGIFKDSELLLTLPNLTASELGDVRTSKYLSETDSLCVVFANGDIILVSLQDINAVEIAGSIEAGIKAASWSPDEELLVLVTSEDQLLLLTKDFDVLAEQPLRTQEFGKDQLVNVGWGHADTQFKGSIGKSAGRTSNEVKQEDALEVGKSDDDFMPRISWRGDAAYFCISSVEAIEGSETNFRRAIRFYSRMAVLQSTAEPSPGLESALAWQLSGSIIAATMKSKEESGNIKRDVIFYERNGLRRYDFALRFEHPEEMKVESLSWNSDSTLLAVHAKNTHTKRHVIQLWTRNNYHWYLKQEIRPPSTDVRNIFWHTEKPLEIFVACRDTTLKYSFSWDILRSEVQQPNDSGRVAVVDGDQLLITPFRYENVPPPMSSYQLKRRPFETPLHASFSPDLDRLAVLYDDFSIELCSGAPSKANEEGHWIINACRPDNEQRNVPLQIACCSAEQSNQATFFILCSSDNKTSVVMIVRCDIQTGQIDYQHCVSLSGTARCISTLNGNAYVVDSGSRAVVEISANGTSNRLVELPSTDECEKLIMYGAGHKLVAITLSTRGQLCIDQQSVAVDCTSFALCGSYLVFTSSSHTARFIRLDMPITDDATLDLSKSESRRVERGSKIVTAVASSMSLVLQMPRGNLETISPRPLVLQVVHQRLALLDYRSAFVHCRRHRIDLRVLFEYDEASFLRNLPKFVADVKEPDYINLFLTNMKAPSTDEPQWSAEDLQKNQNQRATANKICKAMREALQDTDRSIYTNSILTTYACQHPPDLESALQLVSSLRSTDPDGAEDAVKYAIFLSDADKLFDVALGIYDFPLVLLVAQHSNKDPKEYLPFLKELRKLPAPLQRHRINDHLRKYPKALADLKDAGSDNFEDFLKYMQLHRLYQKAVGLFVDDASSFRQIHLLYGHFLYGESRYSQAALSFELGGDIERAIDAYSTALDWQQCFALRAQQDTTDSSQERDFAHDLAKRLSMSNRFSDAARVLLDYAKDTEAAVSTLCEGSIYNEAVRIAHSYKRSDLTLSTIAPAVLDSADILEDTLEEVREQVSKQVSRIAELDVIRREDPDAFFGGPDLTAMDGVEIDDSASTVAGTAFTRYTALHVDTEKRNPITANRRTSKSRRKEARKKSGGEKKGTIWEEDYLLGSLSRMILNRLPQIQSETEMLLPLIVRLSEDRREGLERSEQLQKAVEETEATLRSAVKTVWAADSPRSPEEQAKRDTTGLIKMPVLPKSNWKLAMLQS